MYQKLIIAGYVGNEPSKKYMASDTPVTTFSVATSDYKVETTWWRVSGRVSRQRVATSTCTSGATFWSKVY